MFVVVQTFAIERFLVEFDRTKFIFTRILFVYYLQGSVFSLYLHDAVYMYALATDELFKEGGYKRNGSRIVEIAKNKTFQGEKQLIP